MLNSQMAAAMQNKSPTSSTFDDGIPLSDKLSIKNLLFTRAIPTYVIPVPTAGYKVYPCMDCGDKFLFETSFKQHTQRRSVKISYYCRICGGPVKYFFNRCNLLAHIRSHTLNFKTATINITDFSIEPIPLLCNRKIRSCHVKKITCFDCKSVLYYYGDDPIAARVAHYNQQNSNKIYTCPVCFHMLPTTCALRAHLRLHLKCGNNLVCPECGIMLDDEAVQYPYVHSCPGFMTMRASARTKCFMSKCPLLHPSEFKEHFTHNHIKKVFKCSLCYVASFEEELIKNHLLKNHPNGGTLQSFYQCAMCPGKLVVFNQVTSHILSHIPNTHIEIYECWTCKERCVTAAALIHHFSTTHAKGELIQLFQSLFQENQPNQPKVKNYRVVKQCDQCKRSFVYKCMYNQIDVLPNECPFKCMLPSNNSTSAAETKFVKCYICKTPVPENWEEIKKHFSERHIEQKCVDVMVVLPKINISKYLKTNNKKKKRIFKEKRPRRPRRNVTVTNINRITNQNTEVAEWQKSDDPLTCKKCGHHSESKELLEEHILTHRDPCMAYQCMECGQCFVVKPSFSKHLIIEHNITDVDKYIADKNCYNETALMKHHENEVVVVEPLAENQCKICRDKFDNASDLEKHFRVHGMAFLMKNNRTNSP